MGHVWNAGGKLLATVTFTNESASGWQQQALPTPVALPANTDYVVSVRHRRTGISWTRRMPSPTGSSPGISMRLRAPTVSPGPSVSSRPAVIFSSNYFRDLVFVPGTSGAPTQVRRPSR